MDFFRRLNYLFKPSNAWQVGYLEGYDKGFQEGEEFSSIVRFNSAISKELPRIHSRYAQFQVKIMNVPRDELQAKLIEFTRKEIEHFKMELQDR